MIEICKCYDCGKNAEWLYMPGRNFPEGSDFFCDDCVPRGCSCNYELKPGVEELFDDCGNMINPEEDYQEEVDEDGRKYPCCEYFYREGGWEEEDDG